MTSSLLELGDRTNITACDLRERCTQPSRLTQREAMAETPGDSLVSAGQQPPEGRGSSGRTMTA